jgi:hypothetical protein
MSVNGVLAFLFMPRKTDIFARNILPAIYVAR